MSFAPSIRLELRQHQSLVLTPQLQQAIRLLQMSNLELAGVVDKEVAENPFLERSDREAAPPGEPPAANGTAGAFDGKLFDTGGSMHGEAEAPARSAPPIARWPSSDRPATRSTMAGRRSKRALPAAPACASI